MAGSAAQIASILLLWYPKLKQKSFSRALLEKHSAYFNLLDQLKDPSCPVCTQTRLSLKSFLDSYLYEGVNDDSHWNALSAAGGWCAVHARHLESFSDGLAVSLFYRHEIRKRLNALGVQGKKPGFFSKKTSKTPCPACTYQAEVESGQIHLLSLSLGEAEFWKAFEAHPGLCLPHVQDTLLQLKGPVHENFKSLAIAKLETLCLELDEIVKKSDYRNTERMGSAGDAWKRALSRVYGLAYTT